MNFTCDAADVSVSRDGLFENNKSGYALVSLSDFKFSLLILEAMPRMFSSTLHQALVYREIWKCIFSLMFFFIPLLGR